MPPTSSATLQDDPARPWRAYSPRTAGFRRCVSCGEFSERPGPDGWRWRSAPPKTPGFSTGRAGESLCARCAARGT